VRRFVDIDDAFTDPSFWYILQLHPYFVLF
jgi:hypothetical protein